MFVVITATAVAVTGFALGWFYAYRKAWRTRDGFRNNSLGTYSDTQTLRVARHTGK